MATDGLQPSFIFRENYKVLNGEVDDILRIAV